MPTRAFSLRLEPARLFATAGKRLRAHTVEPVVQRLPGVPRRAFSPILEPARLFATAGKRLRAHTVEPVVQRLPGVPRRVPILRL